MPEVAREDDNTECPVDESTGFWAGLSDLVGAGGGEHEGGPLENAQPVHLEVDGRPAIRLADFGRCDGPTDIVAEGAATVTVCGLPLARKGDGMDHSGEIVEGSPDFLVGGPTFSIPENFDIEGSDAYVSEVIRDLYLISTTPSGRELFERLSAAGHDLVIQERFGDNGTASPNDSDDAKTTGTGAVVSYNTSFWFNPYDDGGNEIGAGPTVVLFHELVHALDFAEGNHVVGPDPAGPLSQPDIAEIESQAIGTGSHDADFPTENSFRADLGLDRRDNHYGEDFTVGSVPADLDIRPGNC
jgi:uncharacterized Zn-binding protein involved in type VI secretion